MSAPVQQHYLLRVTAGFRPARRKSYSIIDAVLTTHSVLGMFFFSIVALAI